MTDYQEELKHLDTISLPDLRNNLGDTISQVSDTDDPIIITENGKLIAAVVSLDDAVLVEWAKDRYYNELAAAKASE
jgi:prevent-host-death family protein|nr:MAG TPA: antitoxin [Caudoviricetes sp.]